MLTPKTVNRYLLSLITHEPRIKTTIHTTSNWETKFILGKEQVAIILSTIIIFPNIAICHRSRRNLTNKYLISPIKNAK